MHPLPTPLHFHPERKQNKSCPSPFRLRRTASLPPLYPPQARLSLTQSWVCRSSCTQGCTSRATQTRSRHTACPHQSTTPGHDSLRSSWRRCLQTQVGGRGGVGGGAGSHAGGGWGVQSAGYACREAGCMTPPPTPPLSTTPHTHPLIPPCRRPRPDLLGEAAQPSHVPAACRPQHQLLEGPLLPQETRSSRCGHHAVHNASAWILLTPCSQLPGRLSAQWHKLCVYCMSGQHAPCPSCTPHHLLLHGVSTHWHTATTSCCMVRMHRR